MRAWTKAPDFDPRRACFRTWLYKIVINRCIDHQRRRAPSQLPEDFDVIDPTSDSAEILERAERSRVIADTVKCLPAVERAAMVLVFEEGMSRVGAGRVLGISAKRVERHLAHARACLREQLMRDDG